MSLDISPGKYFTYISLSSLVAGARLAVMFSSFNLLSMSGLRNKFTSSSDQKVREMPHLVSLSLTLLLPLISLISFANVIRSQLLRPMST